MGKCLELLPLEFKQVKLLSNSSENDLGTIARPLCNKIHEAVEHKFSAPTRDTHRALEAQELLHVSGQFNGSDGRHVGTGSETSRSVSVAILT